MNIITVLINLWNSINGKKTEIAGFIALLTTFLVGFEQNFNIHPAFLDTAISFLANVAGWLGGIGIAHKVVKANSAAPAK